MSLRDQPYLPLYVQDYLTDEKLNMCSLATQGVYIKLLCVLHKSDPYGTILLKQKEKQNKNFANSFAYDVACKFAKILPISAEEIYNALLELIEEGCLTSENDMIYQKRMVADNALSLVRSACGKKGGKKTGEKLQNFAQAKSEANTEDEYEDVLKGVQGENDADKNNIYITPKLFDTFWELYPKKIDKGKTLSKWNQLCQRKEKRPVWKEIKKAVLQQMKSERWQDKTFIPHPTTWLNQSRWLDDPKEMVVFKQTINSNKPKFIMHPDLGRFDLCEDNKYRHCKSGEIYIE